MYALPKILLVQPKTPPSYWSFDEAIRYTGTKAVMPPLSLVTVAGLLPQSWQFRLVDLNIESLADEDLRWADFVFVSGMIIHRDGIRDVLIRAQTIGTATVVGGPFVSSSPEAPELALATSRVIGEIESQTFLAEFAQDLERHQLKPVYRAPEKPELHRASIPRFDLLRVALYNSMALQTSRGCPHGCEFCDIIVLYGRRPRCKTPEQIEAELEAIYRTGFRGNIFFVDDNFIGNIRMVQALLPRVRSWQESHGFPFLFYTEADLRLANMPDLMDDMVRAGFFAVFMGIETPSKQALREARKTQNMQVDLLESVRTLRRHGLLVYGGFILGFDADTTQSFADMAHFVSEAAIDFAMVGMLMALPGTPLARRLQDEGRLIDHASGDQFVLTNIIPLHLTQLELVHGYRQVLAELYAPAKFFARALRALMEWKPGPRRATTRNEYAAVPRSFLWQGLLSDYRWEYWKFLLRVAWHCPKAIPRAFTMAISGAHFFSYTQKVVLPQLQTVENRLSTP